MTIARHVLTILAVEDFARAKRFYADAFGWPQEVDAPCGARAPWRHAARARATAHVPRSSAGHGRTATSVREVSAHAVASLDSRRAEPAA
jgi:hypothetical protein